MGDLDHRAGDGGPGGPLKAADDMQRTTVTAVTAVTDPVEPPTNHRSWDHRPPQRPGPGCRRSLRPRRADLAPPRFFPNKTGGQDGFHAYIYIKKERERGRKREICMDVCVCGCMCICICVCVICIYKNKEYEVCKPKNWFQCVF